MAFWGDNKSLTVTKFADCSIPLKDWDTLIEQSVNQIKQSTEALLL